MKLVETYSEFLNNINESKQSGYTRNVNESKEIKQIEKIDESIDSRFRSEIYVNLKKAGFIPDEDFEYSGSQLYAKDIDVANEIIYKLSNKYNFVIHYGKVKDDNRIPINVAKK